MNDTVAAAGGRPRLSAGGRLAPFRRVLLIEDGENPTSAYYIEPRLPADGPALLRADVRAPGLPDAALLEGSLVLFCRYCSADWLAGIAQVPIAGAALLIDDDMPALVGDLQAPLRYRTKLRRWSLAHWPALSPTLGAVFASTAVLAERIAPQVARVLPPLAGDADLRALPDPRPDLISFHASAVHRAEHEWLEPVIRALLQRHPALAVEIVADSATRPLWIGDPRISVVNQREWPAYRRATSARAAGIMLAPLCPGRANEARAPVKRIDAARANAALIVSDDRLYGVSAREAALGMALPLDRAAWIEGLSGLLGDPRRCRQLAVLNRAGLAAARKAAAPLFRPSAIAGSWELADRHATARGPAATVA